MNISMYMPVDVIPVYTIKQYELGKQVKNEYIYHKIWRTIYGLPQAGALGSNNKLLWKQLAPHNLNGNTAK